MKIASSTIFPQKTSSDTLGGGVQEEVPYSELFGVSYFANVDDVCMDTDGSILAAISDERADGSCYETVVFQISGF